MSAHVGPKREPLLSRAVITSAVGLAVSLGVITTDAGDALVPLLVALGPVVAAFWSRPAVTPLADPKAADGTRLVRSLVDVVLPEAETGK